jgi:hypothetical protein
MRYYSALKAGNFAMYNNDEPSGNNDKPVKKDKHFLILLI